MKHDLVTQLFYGGAWNDVPVYVRDPVEITRGREDEQAGAVPSKSKATLDDRTGDYNPTYPLSPLFGLAGRNTPIRHYLGTAHVGAGNSDTASTTSHVAPTVTATAAGVLICGWAAPAPASTYTVPGSMTAGSTVASSAAVIRGARQNVTAGATGTRTATLSTSAPYVAVSMFVEGPTGLTTGTIADADGTITLDGDPGDWWVVLSAYSSDTGPPTVVSPSDTDGGGWLALADTGAVNVADPDAAWMRMVAWVKQVHRAGASHVVTTGPDAVSFVTRVPFAETTGGWQVRHTGEVAKWAPDRTINFGGVTGDAWTAVDAAGVLRRLGQGDPPAFSALRRAIELTDPLAYWPMEDGPDAIQFVSGILGGAPMVITQQGGVDLAADNGLPGSAALPKTVRNLDVNSSMIARAPLSGIANSLTVGFWVQIPDLGSLTTDFGQGIRITITYAGGDVPSMVIRVFYDPSTQDDFLYVESPDGSLGMAPTTATHSQQWRWIRASIEQSGSSLRSRLWADEVSIGDVSDASTTLGRPFSIEVAVDAGSGTPNRKPDVLPISAGHVAVWAGVVTPADMLDAGAGWAGETAGDRFLRVCGEENIPASLVGVAADTPLMGPQPVATVVNVLAECEATDAGIMFEPRAQLGLTFRTRVSLFNQDPALTLDWDAGQVAPPFVPTLDDKGIRNDITVKRANGSSARAVQTTGPLNVNRPEDDPDGVGRYKVEVGVNPQSDLALPDLASWRRNEGTVDDVRFSTVVVDLDAAPSLASAAALVDIGDLIAVDNVPVDLAADQLRLHVIGVSPETIGSHRRTIAYNTVPATAWRVGVYDADRYESSGTVRETNPISDVQTAITFTITGPMWVTNPARFPFDGFIGGEKVTVTAISAPSGNLQTFTVTRGVNGVQRAWPAGTRFRLARQVRYG